MKMWYERMTDENLYWSRLIFIPTIIVVAVFNSFSCGDITHRSWARILSTNMYDPLKAWKPPANVRAFLCSKHTHTHTIHNLYTVSELILNPPPPIPSPRYMFVKLYPIWNGRVTTLKLQLRNVWENCPVSENRAVVEIVNKAVGPGAVESSEMSKRKRKLRNYRWSNT